jgi:hypothetical protein
MAGGQAVGQERLMRRIHRGSGFCLVKDLFQVSKGLRTTPGGRPGG